MDLLNTAIISKHGGGSAASDPRALMTALQSWSAVQQEIGQETNSLLSLIARAVSEDASGEITDFRTIQNFVRAGQAHRILSVGDQLRVNRLSSASAEGTGAITAAAVDADAFLRAVRRPETANYVFAFDGTSWSLRGENGASRAVTLGDYGITVTGTPTANDTVTVHTTATTFLWDVLGIDCDTPADGSYTHALSIGLHDCIANLQFDAREALFYCEEGLAVGTYNFTVTQHTWVSSDVNKTFQFTLTQEVPAGGQIVLMTASDVTIAGSTVQTFASASSTTEIETATVTEGSAGTSLGDVNNAVNENTNSLQRGLLGSNNYADSPMRQYINSSAAAGSVWTPKTKFNRPPSWAATTAGFLNGMDEDFLSVIGEVTKKTALNTVSDGGGSVETTERFFLLSRSEVYGGNEVTGGEGAAYPYYANHSDLGAPGTGNDSNRIKYRNGAAKYWWLRSPLAGYADAVRTVNPTGNVSTNYATNSYGASPACCIV